MTEKSTRLLKKDTYNSWEGQFLGKAIEGISEGIIEGLSNNSSTLFTNAKMSVTNTHYKLV